MQNTNSTPSNRGISGFRFLVVLTLVVAALFAIGTVIGANNGEHLNFAQGIIRFFREYGVRLLVGLGISLVLNITLFAAVLDTPITKLSGCLARKGNDSHVILFISMLAVAGVMVVGAHGADAMSYVTALLQQGSIGLFVASLITVAIARLFGVRSMDQFADWIETPNNDSYAILVGGVMIVLMYIAMSV